jgi:branched-chain amino acid transport system permease protein
MLDNYMQERFDFGAKTYLKVSGWKLTIFGAVLILMMRFRPEGLLPESRHKRELHPEADEPGGGGQETGNRDPHARGPGPQTG